MLVFEVLSSRGVFDPCTNRETDRILLPSPPRLHFATDCRTMSPFSSSVVRACKAPLFLPSL